MKRINVKLLAFLLGGLLVFVVGGYFLHEFQMERRADSLLVRAEEKKAEEDYETAANLLRKYLIRRPDDSEQYANLALTMKKLLESVRGKGKMIDPQTVTKTYQIIEEALRRNPDDIGLREAAVDFAIQFHRYPDAISHLEHILRLQGDKADPDLKVRLAQCYSRSGKDDQAVAHLSAMVGLDPVTRSFGSVQATDPTCVDAYYLLAEIYRQNFRDPATGRTIVEQMVGQNPDSFRALLNHAQFVQFETGGMALAEQDVQRALQLAPDDAQVVLNAAKLALERRDLNRAKELLDRSLEIDPNLGEIYRNLAIWAMTSRDMERAFQYIEQGLEKEPRNRALAELRANWSLEAQKFDEFAKSLDKLRELNYPRPFLDFFLGREHLAKKEWLQAARKLEEARPHIEQFQSQSLTSLDMSLAHCYEELKQPDRQLVVFENILEREPENTVARYGKIQALLNMNQPQRALAEYELLNDVTRVDQIDERLLLLHLELEMFKQTQREKEVQDWTKAEALVARLLKLDLLSATSKRTLLARYYAQRGDMERHDRILQGAKSEDPQNITFRLNDIRDRALLHDRVAEALADLDQIQSEFGDSVTLRLMRAQILAAKKPPGYYEQLLAQEQNSEGFSDELKAVLWDRLGTYLGAAGHREDMERLWREAAELQPFNVQLRLRLFDVALESGDEQKISAALEAVGKRIGEQSAEFKWARAARILHDVGKKQAGAKELQTARGLIDEALSIRENWEPLYRLLGQVCLAQDQALAAQDAFEKAIALGSRDTDLRRQLALIYYNSGRMDRAAQQLADIPRAAWTRAEERLNLQILATKGQLPDELPVDANSTDVSDHVFISRVLGEAKRYKEAAEAARRAVQIGPKMPETWGLLFQMLFENGQLEDAEKVLAEAIPNLPEDVAPVFLGTAYNMLGKWDLAAEQFRRALELDPDSEKTQSALANVYLNANQPAKAREFLEQMIARAAPDDAEANKRIAWARRRLAELITNRGNYKDFQRALALIDQNATDSTPLEPADVILWARLCVQRAGKDAFELARDKLAKIQQQRRLIDDEKVVLADLCQRLDDWPECQSLMMDVLARRPDDERVLKPWLDWLLNHGDVQQAGRWVQKLPHNSETAIRVATEIDVRRGQSAQAVQRLLDGLGDESDPGYLNRLAGVANIIEDMTPFDATLYDEAEMLWRRYVQLNPDQPLALAAFLYRRNDPTKMKDGFVACGQALQKGQILDGFRMCNGLLRRLSPGSERDPYIKVVRNWYDKAIAKMPTSGMLMIQRSEFEELVGSSTDAEEWMRRFLKNPEAKPQERAVVSNNLAFKLALRGEGTESLALMTQALKDLDHADMRDTLGMVYLARKELPRAISEFETAIETGGPSPLKILHLAVALFRAGEKERAAETIRTIQQTDLTDATDVELQFYDELVRDLEREGLISEEKTEAADKETAAEDRAA
jgi:tetratricopeptide (TPR) repeat protein